MQYESIDIYVTPDRESYQVKVVGKNGVAVGQFVAPFEIYELENFILKVGAARRSVRRTDSSQMQMVRSFGQQLYDSLLHDDTYLCFKREIGRIHQRGDKACLRLHLSHVPELLSLPWEFIYDRNDDIFWALSSESPLIRFVEMPQPVPPLRTERPLRILGVVSNPEGAANLDLAGEQEQMEDALRALRRRGQIGALEIEWLPRATVTELQRALRSGRHFHIFHFLGHGTFDPGLDEGALVFEDDKGHPNLVSATMLGTLLRDHRTLRVAVLNACEGARTSQEDPFAGVAPALVRAGLPASVAMQFEVTDGAAILFAREFYGSLADNLPLYAAVSEARKAIFANNNEVEWATPVVFSRVGDGIIFQLPPPERTSLAELEKLYKEVEEHANAGRWEEALVGWTALRELSPEFPDSARVADYARRQVEAAKLYRRMSGLNVSEEYDESLDVWRQILKLIPGFADEEGYAADAREGRKRSGRLEELYRELGGLVSIGQWKSADEKWREIRHLDPEFSDVQGYHRQIDSWRHQRRRLLLRRSGRLLAFGLLVTLAFFIGRPILNEIATYYSPPGSEPEEVVPEQDTVDDAGNATDPGDALPDSSAGAQVVSVSSPTPTRVPPTPTPTPVPPTPTESALSVLKADPSLESYVPQSIGSIWTYRIEDLLTGQSGRLEVEVLETIVQEIGGVEMTLIAVEHRETLGLNESVQRLLVSRSDSTVTIPFLVDQSQSVSLLFSPPLVDVEAPIEVGRRWSWSGTVTASGGALLQSQTVSASSSTEVLHRDDIQVPAGDFDALHLRTNTWYGQTSDTWIVAGIGTVLFELTDESGSTVRRGELISYRVNEE